MSLMRGAHAALREVSLMSGPAILGTFPMHDSDGCAVLRLIAELMHSLARQKLMSDIIDHAQVQFNWFRG